MGIDRRGILKFIAGGAVGAMFTPLPWKLTDDLSIWTQNWPWIPRNLEGESVYTPSVSKLCPSGCGIRVRTVGGLPVGIRGNEEHPLSQGGVTPLAAAEAQLLYSPSRLRRPLRKTLDGAYVSLTWDEALAMLEEKLGSIKGYRGKLCCVSGDENGTINEVLSGFATEMGTEAFFIMPGEAQAATKAWQKLMDGAGQVGYDFENSDYVLAIGADILESFGPVVATRGAYSASHPAGGDATAKYVYAGAVQNGTAAGADQWVPVKPGSEAAFALGICHLLVQAGASSGASDFDDLVLRKYAPKTVAGLTGVSEAALKKVATELMKASAPVVVPGSTFGQGAGAAQIAAGLAVNILLGRVNKPGGLKALPELPQVVSAAMSRSSMLGNDLVGYLQDVSKGKAPLPEAVVFYEANPVYALPQAAETADILKKIPFKVSFSSFMDETASMCDLILPQPLGIERYDDVANPYGIGKTTYCIGVPAAEPLFDAKPAGDALLTLAARIGIDLGYSSFQDVLSAKAEALGADFDTLAGGEAFQADATEDQWTLRIKAAMLDKALKDTADASFPLVLAPESYLRMGTQNVAMSPFALKTIRDYELAGKEFFVRMNGATASKLGVGEGDRVAVTSAKGAVKARVHIYEGVMTDVVAAPLGFGHSAYDEYTKGKGDNVAKLLNARFEPGTGLPMWSGTRVKVAKI